MDLATIWLDGGGGVWAGRRDESSRMTPGFLA